jgi:hypothetical protein
MPIGIHPESNAPLLEAIFQPHAELPLLRQRRDVSCVLYGPCFVAFLF